jgi:hypothetical protein
MIGANYNLKPSQTQMSLAPVQDYQPQGVTDNAVNQTIATGIQNADARFNLEQLDRPGISRGRGQEYLAGQAGMTALGKAAAQASRTRLADQIATNGLLSGLLN